jgi:hypothetical protein
MTLPQRHMTLPQRQLHCHNVVATSCVQVELSCIALINMGPPLPIDNDQPLASCKLFLIFKSPVDTIQCHCLLWTVSKVIESQQFENPSRFDQDSTLWHMVRWHCIKNSIIGMKCHNIHTNTVLKMSNTRTINYPGVSQCSDCFNPVLILLNVNFHSQIVQTPVSCCTDWFVYWISARGSPAGC